MRKGWMAAVLCAALCACGQSADNSAAASNGPSATSEAVGVPGVATPAAVAAAPPPAFAVCSSCHAVEPGRHGVGPSLAGVFGRKAGSLPGYAYSEALKGSGIVWDAKSLDTWLQGPMKMVPGTKMIIGVSDPAGRKAVIAYLQTLK